jgi:hypothetical protein
VLEALDKLQLKLLRNQDKGTNTQVTLASSVGLDFFDGVVAINEHAIDYMKANRHKESGKILEKLEKFLEVAPPHRFTR